MKSGSITSKPRQYVQNARAEAAEATGQRIVNAFVTRLMSQWFDEITLDAVAEDAGVTVQTVIRRFGGKDGLLPEAVKKMAERINAQRVTSPGEIDAMVSNLLADYEQTGDAVIRWLALEPRHRALKEFLNIGRAEHRRWVSTVLAEPLAALDAAARERAIDKLVIATDVYTWKLLRRDMGRSRPATAAAMKEMIEATLAAISQ